MKYIIVGLIMSSVIFAAAWSEAFINDAGHECYSALSLIDPEGNIDYDNAKLYWACYPSVDDRLSGNNTYYVGDVPDYIIQDER